MFKKYKQFIFGILVGALLFGGISAIADTQIQAVLSDIKVTLNGVPMQFDNPPILYQDRTYLPVRKVAEAVGKQVDYDEASNTVVIADKGVTSAQSENKITVVTPYNTSETFDLQKYNGILYIRVSDANTIAHWFDYGIMSQGKLSQDVKFSFGNNSEILISDIPTELLEGDIYNYCIRYDYFENTVMPILKESVK